MIFRILRFSPKKSKTVFCEKYHALRWRVALRGTRQKTTGRGAAKDSWLHRVAPLRGGCATPAPRSGLRCLAALGSGSLPSLRPPLDRRATDPAGSSLRSASEPPPSRCEAAPSRCEAPPSRTPRSVSLCEEPGILIEWAERAQREIFSDSEVLDCIFLF